VSARSESGDLSLSRAPRRAGRWALRALAGALLVFAALVAGFFVFVEQFPTAASRDRRHSDAIVVLTGGDARVAEGLRLLADGQGDWLLISGVHPDTPIQSLLALAPEVPADLAGRVVLDRVANDTLGNARETARWTREAKVGSLRVVTAAYHMPRSLLELSRALPDVELIAHPVFPAGLDLRRWWTSSAATSLLVQEYLKYLVALVTNPFGEVAPS